MRPTSSSTMRNSLVAVQVAPKRWQAGSGINLRRRFLARRRSNLGFTTRPKLSSSARSSAFSSQAGRPGPTRLGERLNRLCSRRPTSTTAPSCRTTPRRFRRLSEDSQKTLRRRLKPEGQVAHSSHIRGIAADGDRHRLVPLCRLFGGYPSRRMIASIKLPCLS
jgi:hypothetical protein